MLYILWQSEIVTWYLEFFLEKIFLAFSHFYVIFLTFNSTRSDLNKLWTKHESVNNLCFDEYLGKQLHFYTFPFN